MKFSSLEIVRLLKPRLGFGPAEVCEPQPETASAVNPPVPVPIELAPLPTDDDYIESAAQVAMAQLLEQLEAALEDAPTETRERASDDIKELTGLATPPVESDTAEFPQQLSLEDSVEPPAKRPARAERKSAAEIPKADSKGRKTLEGCKVAAC